MLHLLVLLVLVLVLPAVAVLVILLETGCCSKPVCATDELRTSQGHLSQNGNTFRVKCHEIERKGCTNCVYIYTQVGRWVAGTFCVDTARKGQASIATPKGRDTKRSEAVRSLSSNSLLYPVGVLPTSSLSSQG